MRNEGNWLPRERMGWEVARWGTRERGEGAGTVVRDVVDVGEVDHGLTERKMTLTLSPRGCRGSRN